MRYLQNIKAVAMRDRRKGESILRVIIFIVSLTVFQLVFLELRQKFKIIELEQEKEAIKRSRDRWEHSYWQLIKNVSKEMEKKKYNVNTVVPPNTIQAVKYAMKHSHPDNGGNADDFIRFQKCYEELTRNGG